MTMRSTLPGHSLTVLVCAALLCGAFAVACSSHGDAVPSATPAAGPQSAGEGATEPASNVGTAEVPPDGGWPKTLSSGSLEMTVYQPQLDAWDGNRLELHAAASVGEPGAEARTFGVIWLQARSQVDKDTRMVELEDIRFTRVSFPSEADGGEAYRRAFESVLPEKSREIALERLEAELGVVMAEKQAATVPLRNDPPRIVFSKVPAILLFVDGQPVFRPVEGTRLDRLVNTRPLVLKDASGKLYLHLFDGWLAAGALEGPWQPLAGSAKELDAVAEKLGPTNIVDLLAGQPADPDDPTSLPSLKTGPIPQPVVSYVPTELIVTDGEPSWVPVEATALLYVANTTGNVFKLLTDQKTYVLISGRWFRAGSTLGPWEFVPGKSLPADFAAIPDTCPKENVKASVPGTRQAEEAVIANSIPQTAAIDRKTVKITEPVYDGEVQLRPIEGTPLAYVANCATPVIRVDANTWYAVDKGVWFFGPTPSGPWLVATSLPAVIYTIPVSSPLHYVTCVRVYDATPDVVYVGYTPGYTGTVVSPDYVVVYGTGYSYTPWIGTVYFPPPPTFGYGVAVRYTPWTGWTVAVGFGWYYGPVTVGIGWGCYPYWGPWYYPPYYHPPYPPHGGVVTPWGAAAWGPGGWAATTGNVYSHWGSTTAVTRRSGGYNAYTGNRWVNQVGQSYNSVTGQLSAGQRSAVANVYTGSYAAGRRGITTDTDTGAIAAGRETVEGNARTGNYRADKAAGGYNPETGRYAAGEKTTIGNTRSGESVTYGHGTAGNTDTGKSVDYRGVKTDEGTGVGRIGDTTIGKGSSGDVYAGKDGTVYRKDEDGWSKYEPESKGWTKPETGDRQPTGQGLGSFKVPSGLDAQARARQSGERRVQQSQPTRGSWAGTPQRGGAQPFQGAGGGRRR